MSKKEKSANISKIALIFKHLEEEYINCMGGSKGLSGARMAEVIRLATTDFSVLNCIGPKDLQAIAGSALHELSPSELRRFIITCFNCQKENLGIMMVDEAIAYAIGGAGKEELMKAAVEVIAALSTSNTLAKEKLYGLLEHENPAVVGAVVESLGYSSDMERFGKICGLMLNQDFKTSLLAVEYAEECTQNAAFRKREGTYAIEPASEDFLRNALNRLEGTYRQLQERGGGHLKKRIILLIALSYNAILDSTEWKIAKGEEVEKRIYYSLEEHLHEEIGPSVRPLLFKMLLHGGIEEGTEKSALSTLGRLSNNRKHRAKISSWINNEYLILEKPKSLRNLAWMVRDSCMRGKRFSSIPAPASDKTSIVPKGLAPSTMKRK